MTVLRVSEGDKEFFNHWNAIRRQATKKVSDSIMTLTHLLSDPNTDADIWRAQCQTILEDLTRARYLLVSHEEPDGILDELAQL